MSDINLDMNQLQVELTQNLNELYNMIQMLMYIGISAVIVFLLSFTITMIFLFKMAKERDEKLVNLLKYTDNNVGV